MSSSLNEVIDAIKTKFPDEIKEISEFARQVSVVVRKDLVRDILVFLHDNFHFDHLQDLCGVDYKDKKDNRFEVVYQLFSIDNGQALRIRAEVPEDDAVIDTVTSIWEGAGWHERECFDMFGIVFRGHNDLRRVLMPEDWQGYPLRKDYPLKGPKEYWQGFKDVLQKAEEYRQFETKELGA
ncbi:MAG TPA: NADH-quinone oxidoreductase subunit C [Nitrospirae bacterium]|nr:NADH-quinone oxidoreductase subunit C [Nitrospirota bacterium]